MISCRVCFSTNLRPKFSARGIEMFMCAKCQLIQIGIPPSEQELLAHYEHSYFSRPRYRNTIASRLEGQRRANLVRSWKRVDGRPPLLDFGCGSGEFLATVTSEFECWGLDASEEAVRRAKERCTGSANRILSGKLEDLSCPDGYFHCIVLWDVIEHLNDPGQVFSHCRRLLSPGGFLVLSTPNAGSLSAKMLGRRWAFMTPPEHLCLFNRSNLSEILERQGFQVKSWSTKGRWVDLRFLMFKMKQMLTNQVEVTTPTSRFLPGVPFYIPTADVQYLVAEPF